jgi:hypothetical protein
MLPNPFKSATSDPRKYEAVLNKEALALFKGVHCMILMKPEHELLATFHHHGWPLWSIP